MTTCVTLDIETLSTTPDSVILTIGAVKFDPYSDYISDDALYLKIDIEQQLEMGRNVSDDTIEWWAKQDPKVREEAIGDSGDRISVQQLQRELNKFLVGASDIWCQGPVFDIGILENLYRQISCPIAWNFWQVRDSRTLFGVHGDPREKNKTGLHNALEDAYSQAVGVQTIYRRLNLSAT